MEELRQKFAVAGQTVSNRQFLNFLVNSLPTSFDQFATSIKFDTDTVPTIVARLHYLEMRRAMISIRDGTAQELAFVAKRERSGMNESRTKHASLCSSGQAGITPSSRSCAS
jgi:hypothetical protein